ncbi:uncharacterized protein LOC144924536 isoform X2 [Branchiostoma floridae x Branchiostoma belcheri]
MASEEDMTSRESLTEDLFFMRPSPRPSIHRKGFTTTTYSSSTSVKSSYSSLSSSSSSTETKYQPSLVRTTSTSSSTYSSDESPASSPGPETGTAEFLSPRSWSHTSAKTSESGHQSAALMTGESLGSARQSSAMATEKSSNRRDFSPVRGWTEGWMKVLPAYGQDTAAAGIGESYLWSRIGRGGLLSALGNWRVWGNKDELPNGGDRATSTSICTDKQADMRTSSETVVKTERVTVSQTSSSSSAVITSQSASSATSGDQYDDVALLKDFAESEDPQEGEDEVKQMGVTVQTWNQTTSTQNTDTMEQWSGQLVTQHSEVAENAILAASGKDTTTIATEGDTLSVSVNLVGEQGEEEEQGEQRDEGYKTEEELEEKMVVREDGVEVTDEMQANVTDKSTAVTSVETSETIISESLEQGKKIQTTYLEEETEEKLEEDYEEEEMSQMTLETMQKDETVADELVDVSQISVSEGFDHTEQAKVIIIEEEKEKGGEEAEGGQDEEVEIGREVTVVEQEDTAEDGLAEGVMTVISTESTTTILAENHASQDTNVISTMSGVSDEQEKEAYSTAEEQHGDEISEEMNLEEGDTVQEVEVEETDEIINEAARKRRRTYSGGLMSYILPDEEEEEMEVETSSEEESTEMSEESSMETTTGQTETIIARVQEASSESMVVEISTQGDADSSQTGQGETITARVQEASPKSMEEEMSSQTVTSEMIVITSTLQENGEVQEDVIATSSDVEIVGEASQVLTSAKEEYVATEASEATNEVTDIEEAGETAEVDAEVETTGASTHTKEGENIIDELQEQPSTKTIRRARATTSRKSYFLRSKLTPREAKLRASKALEPVTTGQGGKKGEETNTRKRQRVQEDSNSTTAAQQKKQKTVITKTSGASIATDVSLVLTRVDEHSDEKNGLHDDGNTVSETMEGTVTVSETDPQDEQENDEEEKDESASASSEVQTLTDVEVTNVTEKAKETVTDKSVTVVSARVIAETPSKADYWFRSRRKRRLFDTDDGYTVSHTSAAQKHSLLEEHKKSSKSVEETDDLSLKRAEQRKREVKSSEKRTKGRPRKKRRSSVKEVDEDNKEDVLALDEASTVVTAAVTESKAQDEVQKDAKKSNEKMAAKSKTAKKKTEGASKDVDGQKRAYWLRGRKAVREPKAVVPPAGHADSIETVTETRQSNAGGSLKKKQYFILASTKSSTSRSVTTTATSTEKTIIAETSTGHDAEQEVASGDIQAQVETSTAVIENQEEYATKKEDELSAEGDTDAGISVESQAVTMIEEAVSDEKEDMQTKTSLETIDEEVEVQVEVSTVTEETTEEGHPEDEQTSVAEVQEEQEEIVEGEAGEDEKETEEIGQEEEAQEDEEEVVEVEEDDQELQELVVEGVRERMEQDQNEKQEEAEVEKESAEEQDEGKEQTRQQGRRGNYNLRSGTVYYGSGPSVRAGFLAAIATTSLSLSSSTTHVHEDDPQEHTDKVDDGEVMEQEQDERQDEGPKEEEDEEERREHEQVEELAEDKEARDMDERAEESGKADEEDAMEQDERLEEELKDEEKREEEDKQVEKEQTPAVEEEEAEVEIQGQDQDTSQEKEESEEEETERIDEEEAENEIQLNKQDEEVKAVAEEETQKEADEEKAGQLEVEDAQVPAVVEMEETGQDEYEEEELKDEEKTENVEEEMQLEKEQTPSVEKEAEEEIQVQDQDVGQGKEESGEEENEAIEEEEGEEEDEGEESEQKHAETRRQGRRGNYWLRSKTVYYGSGPSARSGFLTAIATTAMSSDAKGSKRTTTSSTKGTTTTQIIEGHLDDESEELGEEVMGQEQDKNQGDKPSDEVVDADEEDEEEKEEESVRMDRGEAEIEEDARQEEEGVKEIQLALSEQVPAEEESVVVVEVKVAEQDERQEEELKDEEKAAEVEEIQLEKEQTPAVEKEEADVEIQGQDQHTREEHEESEEEEETIEGDVVEEDEDDETEQRRDKTRRQGRRGNYWLRSKTVYYGSGPSARGGFLAAIATTAMSSGAKDSSKRTTMTSTEETATTHIIEGDLDNESEKLDEEVMGQEQDENQEEKPREEVMETDEEKKEEEEEEIQVEKEQTSVIEEDEVEEQGQHQDTSQEKDDSEEKEKEEIEEEEGGVDDEEEEDELEGEEEVMGLGKEENQEEKSSEIIKEADEEDEEEEEESVNMDREEDERQEEEGEKEIQLNEQVSDEYVVEMEVEGQDKKEEPDEEEAQAVEEEDEDEEEKYEGRKEVSRSAGRRGNYNLRSRAVYYGSGPSARGGFLAAIASTSMSSGRTAKSQTKTEDAEEKGGAQGHAGLISKKTEEETTAAALIDEDDLEEESGIVDHDVEVERVENITVVSEPPESELQTTTTYFITKITEGDKTSVDVDTDTTSLTRTTVSTVTTTTETSTDDNTMLQDVTSTAGGQTVIISEISEEHGHSMISSAAAVVTHDKGESDGDDSDDEEISGDAGGEQVSEDSMVTNVTSTTETDVVPIVETDTTEVTKQSQEPKETTETIEESLIAMAVEDDRMQRESEAKKGQVTMAVESDTEQEAETSDKVTESEEDKIEEGETVTGGRKGGSRGNYSLRSRTVYYGSGPSARSGFRAAMAVTAIREAGTDRSITSKAKAVLSKKAKKTDVDQAASTSSENSEDSHVVDQEAAVMETSSSDGESSEEIQESSVEDTVTADSIVDQIVEHQTDGTLEETTEHQEASNADTEETLNEQQESEDKDANSSDTEVDTGFHVEQKTYQTPEDDSNGQETLQTSKVADVSQVEVVELPPVSTNASKKRKFEESSVEERPTKGERSQKGSRGNYSLRSRTVYYGSGPSARGGFLAAIATATMSSKQGQSVTSRSAKKSSRVVKSVDDTGEIEQVEEDSVITTQDEEIDDSDIVHKAGVETVETSSSTKFQEGEEEPGTVSTTIVEGITDEDIEGVLEELSESAASGQMSLEDVMAEAASPKDILSENQEESGNVTEVEQNTAHAELSDKEAVSAPPKEETSTLETDDIVEEENDEEINIVASSTSKRSRKKRKIDVTETVELSEVVSTDVGMVEEQTASTADEEESGEMSMKTNTAVESRESDGRSYWLRKRTITYETKAPEVSVMESSSVYEADNNKYSEESNNKATKRAAKATQVVASKKSRKEATVVQTDGESGSPSASIAGMSEVPEESVTSESQTTTEHAMSGTTSVKVTSSEDSLSQKTGTMVTEEGETAMLVYESGTASTSTETTVVTNVEVHSEGICDDTGTPEEVMTTTTKTTTSTTGSRTKRVPKAVTKLSILEELSEGSHNDQHDEKMREITSASETEEAMVSSTSTSTTDQGATSESLMSAGKSKRSTSKSRTVKTSTVTTSERKVTSVTVSSSHTTVVNTSSSSTTDIVSRGSLGEVYSMSLRKLGDKGRRVYTWNS